MSVTAITSDIEILPNLASPLLGAEIIFATDEWFAAADNMLRDEDPVWLADDYTPFGKWMDGWESRRRRTEGHDWCIVKLGLPGVIRAIEVDTAYFTGNYSPKISIYGSYITGTENQEVSIIDKLILKRNDSKEVRPEYGRMGLCADEEEITLVAQLQSDQWTTLVPLSPLDAGYEDTRKTIFQIQQSNGPITHLRINMGPDVMEYF